MSFGLSIIRSGSDLAQSGPFFPLRQPGPARPVQTSSKQTRIRTLKLRHFQMHVVYESIFHIYIEWKASYWFTHTCRWKWTGFAHYWYLVSLLTQYQWYLALPGISCSISPNPYIVNCYSTAAWSLNSALLQYTAVHCTVQSTPCTDACVPVFSRILLPPQWQDHQFALVPTHICHHIWLKFTCQHYSFQSQWKAEIYPCSFHLTLCRNNLLTLIVSNKWGPCVLLPPWRYCYMTKIVTTWKQESSVIFNTLEHAEMLLFIKKKRLTAELVWIGLQCIGNVLSTPLNCCIILNRIT